jgi:hypothetical protein
LHAHRTSRQSTPISGPPSAPKGPPGAGTAAAAAVAGGAPPAERRPARGEERGRRLGLRASATYSSGLARSSLLALLAAEIRLLNGRRPPPGSALLRSSTEGGGPPGRGNRRSREEPRGGGAAGIFGKAGGEEGALGEVDPAGRPSEGRLGPSGPAGAVERRAAIEGARSSVEPRRYRRSDRELGPPSLRRARRRVAVAVLPREAAAACDVRASRRGCSCHSHSARATPCGFVVFAVRRLRTDRGCRRRGAAPLGKSCFSDL